MVWPFEGSRRPGADKRRLLPGAFLSDRLYLLGARLTTTLHFNEEEDLSVFITLFGIPGQARHPRDGTFHCDSELSRSVWTHGRTKAQLILYAQLDCHDGVGGLGHYYKPCGVPVEMTQMETLSFDINVDKLSLIWQANVTEWIDRNDLGRALLSTKSPIRLLDASSLSLRVHFYVAMNKKVMTQTNRTFQPLLSVDIPLFTGSVGSVGPPASTNQTAGMIDPLRFSRSSLRFVGTETKGAAALCVAIFGSYIQPFIPEFIRHHRNMGFGPIVLGVLDLNDCGDGNNNNIRWNELRLLLDAYIQDGTVLLFSGSAPGMNCHTELLKVAFYNSCLYYSKGIAEYVGVWDLDEYWMPPSSSTALEIGTTDALTRSGTARDESRKSVETIQEAMDVLSRYHQVHGCHDDDWCFHGFPSYTVHRRQTQNGKEVPYVSKESSMKRSINNNSDHRLRLVDLFERRDKDSNTVWLKSVAKTKLAFSAGYHEFGSCQRPSAGDEHRPWDSIINPGENVTFRETGYGEDGADHSVHTGPHCRNLRLDGFGSMHHFQNLVKRRGEIPNFDKHKDKYRPDEYIEQYGHMENEQYNLK